MTDATYALLKPRSDGRVMNTDNPKVYWEQRFAPKEKGHLVASQSGGDTDNCEASGGKDST